ncbi:unnamed protein product [Parnassius apollo]|uniref:(apollo) hypothetical protein n=1 Tax=Parnassius apollo TaxID=110799 RepID=A0A8S3W7Y4_PARAO|nr:unnamed protein product [Parnassius apollo]
MELIPEKMLKTICCSCETGCNSLKCGCRKHGLKCTNLCSNCHGSEQCANMEKKSTRKLMIHSDEEPMQTENNVGDEDDDGLEDVEDVLESERPAESNDQEIPSKRQKLMNK